MTGLMVLLALGIYLAISAGVVAWTVRWARRTGHSAKRWSIAAGLVMYLLVFWDHIPTLVLYKYYCATKAGFWVYKTPEQWKADNPGVAETLTWRDSSLSYFSPDILRGYQLNERFIWVQQESKTKLFPVGTQIELIVDKKTSEPVIKRVSVWAGYAGNNELYRFWASLGPYVPNSDFYQYKESFKQLGREVK